MNDIEQELREIGTNFTRAADEIAKLREALNFSEHTRFEAQNDLDYMRERAERAENLVQLLQLELDETHLEVEAYAEEVDDLTTRIGVILLTAGG